MFKGHERSIIGWDGWLDIRVKLDLVYSRDNFRVGEQALKIFHNEVGYTCRMSMRTINDEPCVRRNMFSPMALTFSGCSL
jgi:hypothetical protein